MEHVNGVSKPSFSYRFRTVNKFSPFEGKLEHIRSCHRITAEITRFPPVCMMLNLTFCMHVVMQHWSLSGQ